MKIRLRPIIALGLLLGSTFAASGQDDAEATEAALPL